MLDIRQLRDDPDGIKRALARRGFPEWEVDRVVDLDATHRERLAHREHLRAQVKSLSREVGQARRNGDEAAAARLADQSRQLGDEERAVGADSDLAYDEVQAALLQLPNPPADEAPDGGGPEDNVELRRWWPGVDDGAPEPVPAEHQRVPHWDIGEQLGLLEMGWGAKLSGSMFPLYRGAGARLVRALTAFALDQHADAYEEIRPPTLVLGETMTSTGHLPKFADEAYHVERDDLWAIPTAEVPLTSLHRDDILEEAALPLKFTAATACFRREAGAAGRDTRGLLRVHEFDKVELFAYTTPDQAAEVHADVLRRAEALLRAFGLRYRVLDLCTGDLSPSSARTFDLEVFAPGSDRWLEVSSVSWFRDYQARRANVRYRHAEGRGIGFVHTVNGSGLAWARVWAALVENGRQRDGSIVLPEVLAPYFGADLVLRPKS